MTTPAPDLPTTPPVVRGRRSSVTAIDQRFFIRASMPAFVFVTAITVLPLLIGVVLSFTGYSPVNPRFDWAGLRNYAKILSDPATPVITLNTVTFVGVALAVELGLGLLFAAQLAKPLRGVRGWRLIFVLPVAVSAVAAAVAWKSLFNTSDGWINYFLSLASIKGPNWLSDPSTAMTSVIIADAWSGIPLVAVIVLGGLLSAPREPIEAARVDGASEATIFWRITIPSIAPVVALAAMLRLFDLFRQIGLFQLMTGGGPGRTTNVLNLYVYQATFQFGQLGYGAALGVVLTVVMALIALIVLAVFRIAVRREFAL